MLSPKVQIAELPTDAVEHPSYCIIVDKLGVDLGSVGERALEFVDVMKTLHRWENVGVDACSGDDDISAIYR